MKADTKDNDASEGESRGFNTEHHCQRDDSYDVRVTRNGSAGEVKMGVEERDDRKGSQSAVNEVACALENRNGIQAGQDP